MPGCGSGSCSHSLRVCSWLTQPSACFEPGAHLRHSVGDGDLHRGADWRVKSRLDSNAFRGQVHGGEPGSLAVRKASALGRLWWLVCVVGWLVVLWGCCRLGDEGGGDAAGLAGTQDREGHFVTHRELMYLGDQGQGPVDGVAVHVDDRVTGL